MPEVPLTPSVDVVGAAVEAALPDTGHRLFVGFSGGRDSTVLLHALAARRRRGVVAVHVNHGLHAAAAAWQDHCRAVAARLGVAYLARPVSVPRQGNLEAEARAERYRVFADLLSEPDDVLWLAHHRGDQTETVLLRLLQGRGLYGMPARRPLRTGTLVRPLLDVAAERLQRYADVHRLRWVEDPSNADDTLDRNFLRHRILPPLRERWPALDDAVLAAMADRRVAERRLAEPLGDLAAAESLELAALVDRPPRDAVALLRLWVQARGFEPPRRLALEEWLRQAVAARRDRQPRLQLDGATLARYRGRAHLVRPVPALAPAYRVALPGVTPLPHGDLEVTADPAGFRVFGDLEVRFRGADERLEQDGRRRPLKRLFQASGVPPWLRDSHPLLYDQRGLVAVPDIGWRSDADAASGRRWRAVWRRRNQRRL